MLNVPITPPRVAFIDERTGAVSREWYMFFLSMNNLVTGSNVSLDDVQKGPPPLTIDEINHSINKMVEVLNPPQDGLLAQIAELQKQVNGLQSQIGCCDSSEIEKQIQALQVAPQVDVGAISAAIAALSAAPVTYTADFAVADTDVWVINDKSGSTCTATLPSASTSTGRVLYFQNYQAQTLVSASSNVVPLVGGSAGTAMLAAVAGETCTLVSDGTSWIMTQYTPNNVLLLE